MMYSKFISFLKQIPLPICGLILGLISLGNLLYSKGYTILGNFYDMLGLFLMFLILLKIVLAMKHTISTLNDPIVASVSPTFTMSLMVLSVFLKRLSDFSLLANVTWWTALILHLILMMYFIYLHVLPKELKIHDVYPSWFITFVGIGVISATSPDFGLEVGKVVVWITLLFYFILLPIVMHRVFILRKMHKSLLPLITIITAPGSLGLVGYLTVVEAKSKIFVIFLFILSQAIYFITLGLLTKLLRSAFYPSYAAFTFPLVISATAVNLTSKLSVFQFLNLELLANMEILIAIAIVTYVLIRYCIFLGSKLVQIMSEKYSPESI